jgi:dihydropteroate synthase
MTQELDCGGRILDLSRTHVMGVLNVTPDSFSDGGQFESTDRAVARARQMVDEGASIIDVGGESTRPGAQAVSAEEEIARVIPVIEGIVQSGLPVPVSVDTSKPDVMRAAVEAGAGLINDVRALREPGALEAACDAGVPVCLMHMQGEPRTMQEDPQYGNVVDEVYAFLEGRIQACVGAGIPRYKLLIDPGIGFGKATEHNLSLIKHLPRFCEMNVPILLGLSRKRLIGAVLAAPVDQRLFGSIAGSTLAAWLGASIVRVHDVRATVQAIKICDAVRSAQ